jgi:hypothetical protein
MRSGEEVFMFEGIMQPMHLGAAQSDLAGAEIVEQGPGTLHLCKVEFACLSLGAGCQLAAIEWYGRRVSRRRSNNACSPKLERSDGLHGLGTAEMA